MASLWQKQIEEQFLHSFRFLYGLCPFIQQVAMHLFSEYKLLEEAQRRQARQFHYRMTVMCISSSFLSLTTALQL
jgi:hypothetical protein